jgi:hypothetical protein
MNDPLTYFKAGEKILRIDEKAVFVWNDPHGFGYGVLSGTLWLTSQRIVFQRSPRLNDRVEVRFGSPSLPEGWYAFPLRRIRRAYEFETKILKQDSPRRKGQVVGDWIQANSVLALKFENGGQEFFIVQEISAWADEIMAAVPYAPALPYTDIPAKQHALIHGERAWWFWVAIWGMFVAVLGACFLGFFFVVPVLYAVLRSIGG